MRSFFRAGGGLLLAALLLACAPGAVPQPEEPPQNAAPSRAGATGPDGIALVLIVVVDQLRADRLDPRLPGGLGRLVRAGRVFPDAHLTHARTETCPGHATVLTGRQPAATGIVANARVDPRRMRIVACVADDATDAGVLRADAGAGGRSARTLRVDALGDWLRAARPGARVYAVAGKDRAAIPLGGRRPDAAFWLDRAGGAGFTTSRYYLDRLPPWMGRWDAAGLLAPVPDVWTHPDGEPPNGARPDAYPGEVTRWSTTSPHPVKPEGDTAGSLSAFVASPFVDRRTLDFARELLVAEALGARGETDLLAIGLSGTDTVGHLYGPWSQESRDALLRLDEALGDFLAFLDARFGDGRVLVALTADHGVLPLPEWLVEQGGGCPVPGGRVDPVRLEQGLADHLDGVFGEPPAGTGRAWMLRNGYALHLRPERVAATGVGSDRVAEVAGAWLEQQSGVARVWNGAALDAGRGPEPMATFYRSSRDPVAGADLLVEPAYGCLFSSHPAGTGHGSPHDYDRAVPLVFMGPGVEPGRVPGPAGPVDVAPTLAARLGIPLPSALDGRALPLRDAERASAEEPSSAPDR